MRARTFAVRCDFGAMDCKCLYCAAKKSGVEFTKFAEDRVRDNIQYLKSKADLTRLGEIGEELPQKTICFKEHEESLPDAPERTAVAEPDTRFQERTGDVCTQVDEWTGATRRQWAAMQSRKRDLSLIKANTWEDLKTKVAEVEPGALLDLANRHSSPQGGEGGEYRRSAGYRPKSSRDAGFLNVTEFDHALRVTWTPNLASFRPPCRAGQQQSDFVSANTRQRIVRVGEWMRWYHTSLGFLTLTYKEAKCDIECKKDWDNLLKRIKRSERCRLHDFVWVIERTKKHVIHFHVLFAGFIPKDWVNAAWSEIVGYTAHPNVKKAHPHTIGYIVKYMSKADRCPVTGRRWGASERATRESLPRKITRQSMTWDDFLELHDGVNYTKDHVLFRNGWTLKYDTSKRQFEERQRIVVEKRPQYHDLLKK